MNSSLVIGRVSFLNTRLSLGGNLCKLNLCFLVGATLGHVVAEMAGDALTVHIDANGLFAFAHPLKVAIRATTFFVAHF